MTTYPSKEGQLWYLHKSLSYFYLETNSKVTTEKENETIIPQQQNLVVKGEAECSPSVKELNIEHFSFILNQTLVFLLT